MERKPTLVVALGGNALLKRGEPLEAEIQRQNIELAARTIAGLTVNWRVVLVHGNGPQIGLLALQNSAYDKVTPYPLDVLGAESQGMIGYMLQQALKNSLPQREVSVLLTRGSDRVAAITANFQATTSIGNLVSISSSNIP
ncbi:carbamate kinase [Klebsiella pneumoniae]|nr:carbamate kinase [Klebsiella pneumoniae]